MTLGHWLIVAAFVLAILVPAIVEACRPSTQDEPESQRVIE